MKTNKHKQQLQDKAEVFLTNDTKCHVLVGDGSNYFGKVKFVGENYMTFYDYARCKNVRIFYLDIHRFYGDDTNGDR